MRVRGSGAKSAALFTGCHSAGDLVRQPSLVSAGAIAVQELLYRSSNCPPTSVPELQTSLSSLHWHSSSRNHEEWLLSWGGHLCFYRSTLHFGCLLALFYPAKQSISSVIRRCLRLFSEQYDLPVWPANQCSWYSLCPIGSHWGGVGERCCFTTWMFGGVACTLLPERPFRALPGRPTLHPTKNFPSAKRKEKIAPPTNPSTNNKFHNG